MASLSGNKVKDTFGLLLKLATATASTTEQYVQDGEGNDTALKLSTDTVDIAGDFVISQAPATSSTELTALLIGTSGLVVTRELDSTAFGSASVTALSPLTQTGNTLTVDDAGNLSQITESTAEGADKFLIWDETASAYKYINLEDVSDYVQANLGSSNFLPVLGCRVASTVNVSTTETTISFADIGAAATSSVSAGLTNATHMFFESTSLPNDTIVVTVSGTYKIDLAMEIVTSSGTPDVTLKIYDDTGAATLMTATRGKATGTDCISFYAMVTLAAENRYSIRQSATSATQISTASVVTFTQIA